MKNLLFCGLLGCVLGGLPSAAGAVEDKTVERGETLQLTAPEGFQNYQWQVAVGDMPFMNLPEATGRTLQVKVNVAASYRAVTSNEGDAKTVCSDTTRVALTEVTYSATPSVLSAAHGYVETRDGRPGAKGITIPEENRENSQAQNNKKLTAWTNGNAMAVYYIKHPRAVVDTKMNLKVKAGATVQFRITVWDPTAPAEPLAENYVAVKGTGATQTVDIAAVTFPRRDYFRYQVECLKGWTSIEEISTFEHYSPSSVKSVKSDWLSSPSVHLSSWESTKPGFPKGRNFDWAYQEVMMPAESDIVGTYVMSLGVLSGYMGIQMNGYNDKGESLHEVIFSQWDKGSTDEDPNLPMNLRASVVDHDEKADVKRFGGEGTGMQTFYHGHLWEAGTYVQFITNCRPDTVVYTKVVDGVEQQVTQYNMLVSAWFNARDGKGWQYMSTLRLPQNTNYIDSWYSFLENYNWPTGQAMRKGFYRNGYLRAKNSGTWYHCNRVGFGNTDGDTNRAGSRSDFGQGRSAEDASAFFMSTGGYVKKKQTASSVALNTSDEAVDTVNLEALKARVDLAIRKERDRIEAEEAFNKEKLDKTGWKMLAFSSEETSGEGTNGRAKQIIDGDLTTYWHSKWQGGAATYPHTFTIDMADEMIIRGGEIQMGSNTNRYIQSFNLYGSNDRKNWTKIYTEENVPVESTYRFMLDAPVTMRYVRLQVTKGRATDGNHVVIYEFDLVGVSKATSIAGIHADAGELEVKMGGGRLQVKAPVSATNARVSLYLSDGTLVTSRHFDAMKRGEWYAVPVPSQAKGLYVVVCTSSGKRYSSRVLLNG